MNKTWEFYDLDDNKVKQIQEENNINQLLATMLANRNIIKKEEVNLFLNPTRNDFHDPFLMPDMNIAVGRIKKAIVNKEKVIIYGDYDVDGITSITVLKSFLEERGLLVDSYIPNRLEEGYGLNKQAIKSISEKGYTLIITVDCGISAIEEIKYSNNLGIETIVTDHHEAGDTLPNALAVVDCKRKDNKYPFRDLAGVGVVFKLIQALGISLGLEEKEYLKYLDIVCVGTISDIVPLIDENRIIAKLGLKLVEVTKNIGLKSILRSSGYQKINSNTISFGVAPRINACGRMGHQEEALKIFLSKNIQEVNDLTNKLNNYNHQRQEIEKNIYKEAVQTIEQKGLNNGNTIVVGGENWHHGVIGIVASKITDLYFKPSILLCYENDIGKGSGRSIPGFDLHHALTQCQDELEKFGGHAMAIGLTVKREKEVEFRNHLNNIAKEERTEEIIPKIKIDMTVNLNEINKDMVKSLQELEPFGEANKMPVFAYRNLKIDSIRALSEGKHLKLTLKSDHLLINAIGFNMGNLAEEYKIGDKVDIAGVLELNSFNGIESLQINMRDMMQAVE